MLDLMLNHKPNYLNLNPSSGFIQKKGRNICGLCIGNSCGVRAVHCYISANSSSEIETRICERAERPV
jgi:hypothetical protein